MVFETREIMDGRARRWTEPFDRVNAKLETHTLADTI